MRPRTDTQTDTQTRVTTIHFASSTTHAKCNVSGGSVDALGKSKFKRLLTLSDSIHIVIPK